MTTKYYCDVCEKETEHHNNVTITQGARGEKDFDVCDFCLNGKTIKDLAKALYAKISSAGSFTSLTLTHYNFVE